MLPKQSLYPRISYMNYFDKPDSGIQTIKDRLEKVIQLTMEKAIAHIAEPGNYPLPNTPSSLERIFADLAANLPRGARKDAVEKYMPLIKGSINDREAVYGPLKVVNLRSSASMIDQAKAVP